MLQGERLGDTQLDGDFKCPGNYSTQEKRCGGFKRSGLLATGVCDIPHMFFCEKPASGSFKPMSTLRSRPTLNHDDFTSVNDFN